MVVALGALEADAHEDLRRRLGQVVGRAGHAEVVGRAVGVDRPLRRDQLLDHRADRLVGAERVAEPEVEREHPLRPSFALLTRRMSPHFRAQKSTYSGRSSRRSTNRARLSGDESARNASISSGVGVVPIASSIARRRNSASVQRSRRDQPQLAPLGGGLLVEDVVGGERERLVPRERDGQPGHRGVPLVADHHVGLALADGAGQAVAIDPGHGVIQAVEPGLRRHVAHGAVAQSRQDHEPLILAGFHQAAVGQHLDPRHCRIVLAGRRRPLLQPEADQRILVRPILHPPAPAMRDGERRLEQQEALLGRERRDPPSLGALDDRRVVGLGLEPQQGEPEPPLAVLRPVARPLVAPELREDRLDLVPEADRPRGRRPRHLDRHARLGLAQANDHPGAPVGDGADRPLLVDRRDARLLHLEPRPGRHVDPRAVGQDAEDHEPLDRLRAREPGPRRQHLQSRRRVGRLGGRDQHPEDDGQTKGGSNAHGRDLGVGDRGTSRTGGGNSWLARVIRQGAELASGSDPSFNIAWQPGENQDASGEFLMDGVMD